MTTPSARRPRRASARPPPAAISATDAPGPAWTFLSNHAHVLLCLARSADPTVREIAAQVGITERAVHRILGELEQGGYVTRARDGRRNSYAIHPRRPLRHRIEAHRTIGDLIAAIDG